MRAPVGFFASLVILLGAGPAAAETRLGVGVGLAPDVLISMGQGLGASLHVEGFLGPIAPRVSLSYLSFGSGDPDRPDGSLWAPTAGLRWTVSREHFAQPWIGGGAGRGFIESEIPAGRALEPYAEAAFVWYAEIGVDLVYQLISRDLKSLPNMQVALRALDTDAGRMWLVSMTLFRERTSEERYGSR